MKPTERTLKYLRDDGYICDMVERWIRNPKHPAGGFRRDLFGFADILAFKPDGPDLMLVQSCGQDYAAHRRKIKEAPINDAAKPSAGISSLPAISKEKETAKNDPAHRPNPQPLEHLGHPVDEDGLTPPHPKRLLGPRRRAP